MKRFFGSIIVALCLCVGVAYAANDYNLTPEIASAYFEVVDGLAEQNNVFLMQTDCKSRPIGYEHNFWDARLVDFDGDKVPELFFMCDFNEDIIINQNRTPGNIRYEVWGWNGHEAYQIAVGQACSRVSGIYTDGFMEIKGVLYEDGRAYLPKMTLPNGTSGSYSVIFYTVENGKWVSSSEKFMRAEDNLKGTGPKFINATIGEKSVTSQQFEQRCNEINNKAVDIWHLCDYDANGKRTLDPKFKQFVDELNIPLTVTSNVETVQIDGKPVKLQFYNVGGYNYVRLRDFAAALKNTNTPFDVQWKYGYVLFIHDKPYSGEANVAKTQTGIARRAAPEIRFLTKEQYADLIREGHFVSRICDSFVRALNIGDENYIKLRELCLYAGCSVDWDRTTGTVLIDTSEGYPTL